jgi:hypothetical protein
MVARVAGDQQMVHVGYGRGLEFLADGFVHSGLGAQTRRDQAPVVQRGGCQ